jgi:acetyltransferase-like isoleucine patch superfamily enzyme
MNRLTSFLTKIYRIFQKAKKSVKYISNSFLVIHYRLNGINISFKTTISQGCKLTGKINVHDNVYIGKNVLIQGEVVIESGSYIDDDVKLIGNIKIGENTTISCFTTISTMPTGFFKIGNDVLVNSFSVLGASESVEIKNHCIFAPYVHITDASHGFEDPLALIKHSEFITDPVTIEENVWLGSGVMVMKGVVIGEGAVIGAKSLVTKSIPKHSVAYGIPAQVKRIRGSKI